jgi:ribosomal protein L23
MKHDITYKPHITEKTTTATADGFFAFVVPTGTRKVDFKKMFELAHKTKITKISSKILKKVVKRRRGKSAIIIRNKFIIVKVPKGTKIDGFEVTSNEKQK